MKGLAMKALLQNWKTSSTGVIMVAGAIIHLAFQIHAKTANENSWTLAVSAIVGGIGLIFAGDAAASVTK